MYEFNLCVFYSFKIVLISYNMYSSYYILHKMYFPQIEIECISSYKCPVKIFSVISVNKLHNPICTVY